MPFAPSGAHLKPPSAIVPPVFVAALHSLHGDPEGFGRLALAFCANNPGYGIEHVRGVRELPAISGTRIAFLHGGSGDARMEQANGTERLTSPFTLGDVVLLRAHETLRADAPFDAVVFATPEPFAAELPTFLRPDADTDVGDQPGGCATDAGAYRRILLTWSESAGPYTYRALNAHRVRMDDSFSHFHPREGGFDELYLVQGGLPGAAVLHSADVERILAPESVTAAEAADLIQRVPVAVGDLVYIPRGEMHRGVGGVLAHVVTVPGFVPGRELGLDHCLRAINERLGLSGEAALPYHVAASASQIVR